MLLKVINDLIAVSNIQNGLIRDLIQALEDETEPAQTEEGRNPAVTALKRRAEDTYRMLDIIEHENRRL